VGWLITKLLVNDGNMVRITHAADAVVQLPFQELGFRHHAVYIYISFLTEGTVLDPK
jgi:hypothetical protein